MVKGKDIALAVGGLAGFGLLAYFVSAGGTAPPAPPGPPTGKAVQSIGVEVK